jgi:hypothetical protein
VAGGNVFLAESGSGIITVQISGMVRAVARL